MFLRYFQTYQLPLKFLQSLFLMMEYDMLLYILQSQFQKF